MIDEGGTWVDSVLVRTAPIRDSDLALLDLTKAFDDLLVNVLDFEVPRKIVPLRRRRLSRKAGTLVVAVVIVAGGGAAAAVRGGALTGLFGPPGMTENDTSEYVNIAASNFPALVHQLSDQLHAEGLRFAPGINPNEMVGLVLRETERTLKFEERGNTAAAKVTREQGSLMDVTGVKGRIAALAQCSWQQSWIRASEAGSTSGENAAVKGLSALNVVKTVTRSKTGDFSGSIMAETNQKKALIGYIGRMRDGDIGFIQRITTLNCPAGT